MDFQLKQWREVEQKQQKEEEEEQSSSSPSKMPRLVLQLEESDQSTTSALPLFVNPPNQLEQQRQQNQPTSFQDSSKSTPPNKAGGMVGGGYFSVAQWQELELQALIFRHMVAGAAIPPELLQLVKRSLIDSPSFYLQSHPYFQPASVLQPGMMMGYWGSRGGAMDPEPGRCRRTDGKKWRCSRDVVAGHKYCERHVHRGRNRSRKPVEFSLPNNPNPYPYSYPCPTSITSSTHFSLSGGSSASLHSSNHLNLLGVSRSKSDSKIASELERNEPPTMALAAMGNDGKSNGHVLRRFFDDWPQESTDINAAGNPPTCLSISTPGIGNNHHPSSSDFLKLSTGNNGGEDVSVEQNQQQQQQLLLRSQLNWNRMGPTGGPLGEALRSPSGGSSLTSVHQLTTTSSRSVSDTSYVPA